MLSTFPTTLEGVIGIEPKAFGDERGYFKELFHRDKYCELGIDAVFVQDNVSFSKRGVIRGLHQQLPNMQAKLISVLEGAVFDVAVDVRLGSPTFGQWFGTELSSENHRQLFIPEGFFHGFCVLSDHALVTYKCSRLYDPKGDTAILYNDPEIGVAWPEMEHVLSAKDLQAKRLSDIDRDLLSTYRP
jgi:dTDP-4-dehydrorhamnose 3,5-epimerase